MIKFKAFLSDEELNKVILFKSLLRKMYKIERCRGNLVNGFENHKLIHALLASINTFEENIIPIEAVNPIVNKVLQSDIFKDSSSEYDSLRGEFAEAVDPKLNKWRTYYYPEDVFLLTELTNKFEFSEFSYLMLKLSSPLCKTIRTDLSKKLKGEVEEEEYENYWFSLLFLNIEMGIVPLNWFISSLYSITTKKDSAIAGEINEILEFIMEIMKE